MVDPLIVAKPAEPNRGRPPVVAVAERMLREGGGFDHVPEPVGDGFDLGVGAILRRLRIGWHLALVGSPGDKRKAGKGWDRQPAMGSPHYEDRTWTSPDGLTLHYRDYAGPAGKPPILCIPGLTRNARDFEPVVDSLAGEWRIICAELRGRGESEYARDSSTYAIPNYVADIETLLKQAQIARFVACGTSLGGIITLLLALRDPHRIAGAILNDIGTVVEPAGLARIAEYVGQGRSFPTWMHAARWMRQQNGKFYPDFDLNQWLQLSKRVMKVASGGRIRFDYDMKIADPIQRADGVSPPPDLWPGWMALQDCPALLLRGELSDILSVPTAEKMVAALPRAELVTVPRVGHAPVLDEPASQESISRLLAKVK